MFLRQKNFEASVRRQRYVRDAEM